MKIDISKKFIIGMVHLLSLRQSANDMNKIIADAITNTEELIAGGVDAICLVNEGDSPRKETISIEEKERFLMIAKEIRQRVILPLGICVLYNDWHSTFAIASESNADFARIDVFVDDVSCDAGVIMAQPEKIVIEKQKICPGLQLFVDVHPKYKIVLSSRTLVESVKESAKYAVDGVIITGGQTGEPPSLDTIISLREQNPSLSLLVGSGINIENIHDFYKYINGAFIGTAFKNEQGKVDSKKVQAMVSNIQKREH